MRKHADMIIFCILFSGWAFITCLNDTLTNILKQLFELTQFESQFVPFSFFIAYFVCSLIFIVLPMLKINLLINLGLKKLVILGLIISALGCIIFIPAAHYRSYGIFLFALFTIGFGFTFLQISVNPMVLSCGAPNTAASRLNIAGGFNSLATALSPIIGSYILYRVLQVINHPKNLKFPYIFLATMLLLLALLVYKVLRPADTSLNPKPDNYQKLFALNHANLVFGSIAIFFYVGVEVTIGTNLITYLKSKSTLGLSNYNASTILAFYWSGAMIARFIGGIALSSLNPFKKKIFMILSSIGLTILTILLTNFHGEEIIYYLLFQLLAIIVLSKKNCTPRRSLTIFAAINIVNTMIAVFFYGSFPAWTLLSVGIFNSIMWPNIFDLSLHGLEKYEEQGSSILILMLLGGALMPILQGKIADMTNISISFIVPAFGYIYIMCYGIFYNTKKFNFIK